MSHIRETADAVLKMKQPHAATKARRLAVTLAREALTQNAEAEKIKAALAVLRPLMQHERGCAWQFSEDCDCALVAIDRALSQEPKS